MAFDCSWLSRYKHEAEWVFCGGHHRMQINTVRVPLDGDWHNYQENFIAFNLFDSMILGTQGRVNVKKCHFEILSELIDHCLEIKENKYEAYINETFRSFTRHKRQIVLNMHTMYNKMEKIAPLIMKMSDDGGSVAAESSHWLNKRLFLLFKNVQHIIIYSCTARRERFFYEVDLGKVLSLLTEMASVISTDLVISIKAARNNDSGMLEEQYKQWQRNNKSIWEISFVEGTGESGYNTLSITRSNT
eukprot:224832_1